MARFQINKLQLPGPPLSPSEVSISVLDTATGKVRNWYSMSRGFDFAVAQALGLLGVDPALVGPHDIELVESS